MFATSSSTCSGGASSNFLSLFLYFLENKLVKHMVFIKGGKLYQNCNQVQSFNVGKMV